jgi:hypothetical protein
MIELGGNIKLVGFKDLEPAKLIVVKKIVGNYARKINDTVSEFQELSLHLKGIHGNEETGESKFEIQGKLIMSGKNPCNAEVTDFNLFYALDKVLDRIMTEAK